MTRLSALFFLLFIAGTAQLDAQNFRPYLIFGSNLTEASLTQSGNSQIDFRMGFNIGVGVPMRIGKRLELSSEILYSENGLYVEFVKLPLAAIDKITLQYFEVPILLVYDLNINKSEKGKPSKQTISAGLTYARLFNHKVIAVDDTDVTNDVRFDQKNALLFNAGATTFLNKSLALNGKVTVSTFGRFTFAVRLLYYI